MGLDLYKPANRIHLRRSTLYSFRVSLRWPYACIPCPLRNPWSNAVLSIHLYSRAPPRDATMQLLTTYCSTYQLQFKIRYKYRSIFWGLSPKAAVCDNHDRHFSFLATHWTRRIEQIFNLWNMFRRIVDFYMLLRHLRLSINEFTLCIMHYAVCK